MQDEEITEQLRRIADQLTGQRHVEIGQQELDSDVHVLEHDRLISVAHDASLPLDLLQGLDRVADILRENTIRFAKNHPANNALLWGARGMGKSSLIKSVHRHVAKQFPGSKLQLIEVHRDDLAALPALMRALRQRPERFLLFCDELTFDVRDQLYRALKSVLDGGVEGRPSNALFYATSNRRHLVPRDMAENEQAAAIHANEAVEESVSLSDRFGLWLGFHSCDQPTYLKMIDAYAEHFGLKMDQEELHRSALEWATTRGSRSGRVAWQFMQSCAT